MVRETWLPGGVRADLMTAEEMREYNDERADRKAHTDEMDALYTAEYRAMICALGQALTAENANHPMLGQLRMYYAACTSNHAITFVARFLGQRPALSIGSIVGSLKKRGLPVSEYFDVDDEEV